MICDRTLRALEVLYPESPRLTTSNRRSTSVGGVQLCQPRSSSYLPGARNGPGDGRLTCLKSTMEGEAVGCLRSCLEERVAKKDDLRIRDLWRGTVIAGFQ